MLNRIFYAGSCRISSMGDFFQPITADWRSAGNATGWLVDCRYSALQWMAGNIRTTSVELVNKPDTVLFFDVARWPNRSVAATCCFADHCSYELPFTGGTADQCVILVNGNESENINNRNCHVRSKSSWTHETWSKKLQISNLISGNWWLIYSNYTFNNNEQLQTLSFFNFH